MQWNNKLVKENNVKFDITIWQPENVVWLNNFIVTKNKRKQHLGSKIMDYFIKWLDENNYNGKLLVSDCYGTSEEVLINFYKKFGFNNIEKNKNSIYLIRKYIDKK